jgi:hypothetical protein
MPTYDFRTLSAFEFEALVRDLLQKDLGVHVESFKRGRDSGIDLRFFFSGKRAVVQCKHYVESGYAKLLSQLRKHEVPKVQALAPSRYILATSVGLTPANKDELAALFTPACAGLGDVFGADDLNALLARHPEVEQTHFKLWLTSSEVLRTLLHSDLFNESLAERERIARRLRLYVQHRSYGEAAALLNKYHFCVVAGQPGIGKTTLAETLVVDHLRQGFEVLSLSRDIRDAFKAFRPGAKQLFVYDDFLGTTAVEATLHKNEDTSLIRLLDLVAHSPNSRLLLTTRELILNRARQTHEKLASAHIDMARCTITVESYTPVERAAILHNHIWFSELGAEYKRALLKGRSYRRILRHRNYIPRIIEWMTAPAIAEKVKPEDYVSRFLEYLEHPHELWRNAFEQQLSERARHLLYVIATLPPVLLSRLEWAYDAYRADACREYGIPRSELDLRHALQELEQAFVAVEPVRVPVGDKMLPDAVVRVHHPSVADFLESQVRQSPREALRLARTAVAFDQIVKLWSIVRTDGPPMSQAFAEAIAACADAQWDSALAGVREDALATFRGQSGPDSAPVMEHDRLSIEARLCALHRVCVEAPTDRARAVFAAKLDSYLAGLNSGRLPDSDDAKDLLERLRTHAVDGSRPLEAVREVLRKSFLEDSVGKDEIECLAVLAAQAPYEFSPEERETLHEELERFAQLIVTDGGYTDLDELEGLTGTLQDIEASLGISLDDILSELDAKRDEIKEDKEEHDAFSYDSYRDAAHDAKMEDEYIDRMFEVFDEDSEIPPEDPPEGDEG